MNQSFAALLTKQSNVLEGCLVYNKPQQKHLQDLQFPEQQCVC